MSIQKLILGSLIWLLLILILALPIYIMLIWKGTAILIVKCFRRNWRVLGFIDLISPNGSDKTIVNVGFACVVDGTVRLDELRDLFSKTFLGVEEGTSSKLKYEKFHSNLVTFLGVQFAQVLSKIDLNSLITTKTLGENDILENVLAEWLLTEYPVDSPLWEIILMPQNGKNETVIAFKIHHAFADGYSLVYILDKLTGNSSPYLVKDFNETFTETVSQMLQFPCHLKMLQPPDPQNNPFKAVPETKYRLLMSFVRLDMRILKKLRRHFDVSFSVLISSLIGSVLRRYLLETRPLERLPPYFAMVTSTSWPNHPSRSQSTPFTDRMCNHWSTGNMEIAIQTDDPVARLKESQKFFKKSQELGSSKFLKRFAFPLAWLFHSKIVYDVIISEGVVGGYSDWIGGQDYRLFGKTVSKIHPLNAIHDWTQFVSIKFGSFTHGDHLEVTVSVNPQHFPDRDVFDKIVHNYLPEEVERLRILSGIRRE